MNLRTVLPSIFVLSCPLPYLRTVLPMEAGRTVVEDTVTDKVRHWCAHPCASVCSHKMAIPIPVFFLSLLDGFSVSCFHCIHEPIWTRYYLDLLAGLSQVSTHSLRNLHTYTHTLSRTHTHVRTRAHTHAHTHKPGSQRIMTSQGATWPFRNDSKVTIL